MTSDSEQTEPQTTLVRSYSVRRDDDDLDAFLDVLMSLLEADRTVIDVSRYDRRADVIELRVINRDEGGAQ